MAPHLCTTCTLGEFCDIHRAFRECQERIGKAYGMAGAPVVVMGILACSEQIPLEGLTG